MQCFANVSVALPTHGGMHHARETWSNIAWIEWCTGELRVDRGSLIMVFSPGGCGPKPLGCLVSATQADQLTVVASTNDSVHGLIRFSFLQVGDAMTFAAMVQPAETLSATCHRGTGSRRSTMTASRRSSMPFRDDSALDALHAHLSHQFPGQLPMVFGGSELYGPDPHGDKGSEVLLGRGAAVIVDPINGCRVGVYELFFYEEGNEQPCLRLPIGPRTRLLRQPNEALSDRLSFVTQRVSFCSSDSRPAIAYTLSFPGVSGLTLAFDSETEAETFERDFAVRQRLVALSLKTSRGWRFADTLENELMELRRRGLLSMARRILLPALVLVVLLLFLNAAGLFLNNPHKSLLDITTQTLDDAGATARYFGETAAEAGATTCGLFMQAISVPEVRHCAALPYAEDAHECIRRLVTA